MYVCSLLRKISVEGSLRRNKLLHPYSEFPTKNTHIKLTACIISCNLVFSFTKPSISVKNHHSVCKKIKKFTKMSRSCFCNSPIDLSPMRFVVSRRNVELMTQRRASVGAGKVRASKVESYGNPNFAERMERAWLISQTPVLDSGIGRYMHQMVSDRIYGGLIHQPRPVACSTCASKGHVECKWCSGTGFFILGDNMLCQVPSRNTTCVICAGKGSGCCSDCKGTGYRAKWMGKPPVTK